MDSDSTFNDNVDSSTLQVAFKNMKERHKRLQKKIGLLEDENNRLIDGKSDLYSEIGKMEENSIKLREKNLKLNQEIHSKHKECCSLKDKFMQLSEENIRLSSQVSYSAQEKGRLVKQVEEMHKENEFLRDGIYKALGNFKTTSGVKDGITQLENVLALSPPSKSATASSKIKVIPAYNFQISDDLVLQSFKEDSCSEMTSTLRSRSISSFPLLEKTKDNANTILSILKDQKKMLLSFNDLFDSLKKDKNVFRAMQAGESTIGHLSELPTFGSFLYPGIPLNKETELSRLLAESQLETNIVIGNEMGHDSSLTMPFDWRKINIDEDEETPSIKVTPKPNTRTVSTSPDHIFIYDESQKAHLDGYSDEEDIDRTCPMCKATFSNFVPQESFETHVVNHFEVDNDIEVIS